MADNLSQLLATPLQPLREQWYSAAQAELLRAARARHEQSPDAYWTWVAEQQRWMQPWDTVRTGELGGFTYFGGGRMNVADNCVDRWAGDPATADRTAVIWEGEPGDVRTVTYAELASEVSRLAGALASLGVAEGDVVAIYMPNAIEAFTAVHACNRIGAVYTILFSGFGPDAVRSRLAASRAKVVLVLDASYRRGQLVPLLDTLRTARGTAGAVEHTIVVDRTGRGVPLQPGEMSYADALGRADDVINVAAHRISTLEIEAIATAHPQVAEAAVVGVTDATKGTVPVAFLTLLDGADPGRVRQDVSAEVASQLGGYARLGAVYLTSALPKTRTGKIMRRLLRDVVEHGGPQGDISAMEDLAGLQAAQQAVAAEAASRA
ncbi:MAG: AMP-binding protein [Streptosporangiaceae bacterium]|jgi:acyl-coenzyme A synthetase/AMP-(fatty) acid ligase